MLSERGKAILFTAANKPFEFREFPLPSYLEPGAVLVRTRMATVCGSDMHTWRGRRPFPVPSILGHETVGTVAALGESVDTDTWGRAVSVGDRIIWTIMSTCGTCVFCRMKGLPQKCTKLFKYGHVRSDLPPYFTGGFAEYVYLRPGTCFFKVPEDLRDEEAAPLPCAAATVTGGFDVAEIEAGDNVVIQGVGMLGLYAIAMARERNPKHVIVIDTKDNRLQMAEDFGADIAINISKLGVKKAIHKVVDCTAGLGADLVVEVTGDSEAIPPGVKMLRIGGRYLLLGAIYPDSLFQIDSHDIITKCLKIVGMHNYDAKHLGRALAFIHAVKDRYPFKKLVGPTIPLSVDGLSEAMKLLESGESIRPAIVP